MPADSALAASIAQAERAAAAAPADFRTQLQLRMLYLAAGRTRQAQAPWPGGPAVTSDGRLEVTSDREAFTVTARVTATKDGAVVFDRTWEERIPRDLV